MSLPKPTPSSEELHTLFRYDAESGLLFYRERPLSAFNGSVKTWERFNSTLAGKATQQKARSGYLKIVYRHADGQLQTLMNHRIIWKMAYGVDAYPVIDHIDRNKTNNRLSNLRQVTHRENCLNHSRIHASNPCVYAEPSGRYKAQISSYGRSLYLGMFDSREEASRAAEAARKAGA